MSREPDSMDIDDTPGGADSETENIPAGRRFSGSPEILEIERELVAEGVDLPNRAIPISYRQRDYDSPEDVQDIIETEAAKEHPNRQLIGYLNTRKQEVAVMNEVQE